MHGLASLQHITRAANARDTRHWTLLLFLFFPHLLQEGDGEHVPRRLDEQPRHERLDDQPRHECLDEQLRHVRLDEQLCHVRLGEQLRHVRLDERGRHVLHEHGVVQWMG